MKKAHLWFVQLCLVSYIAAFVGCGTPPDSEEKPTPQEVVATSEKQEPDAGTPEKQEEIAPEKPAEKEEKQPKDKQGPKVVITSPERGLMLKGSESKVTIKGTATDEASGLATVKINGKEVTVNEKGEFSHTITSKWGLNIIAIEAEDKKGNVTTYAQSYIWSQRYHPMGATPIGKGIIVRLNQKALDDGDPKTLNDLASIFVKVLDSVDIDAQIPSTLASGKTKYKPPVGPKINISYTVTKNGKATMGKKGVKIQARKGGLAISARFNDLKVPVRGKASKVLDKKFTVEVSYVDAKADLNLSYTNGKVSVVITNIQVDVSKVEVKGFNSAFNFLNEAVATSLKSKIKSALEDTLKKKLPEPMSKFINGFSIDRNITLPEKLGKKQVKLTGRLEHLAFDDKGGTISLGVGASAAKGIPSGKLGTPMGPQKAPTWTSAYPFGSGIAFNTLNHALTTAWYTGAFHQDLTKLLPNIADLPIKIDDLKAQSEAKLPLLLQQGTDGKTLEVAIGDMFLSITGTVPGFGKATIQGYISALFHASGSITQEGRLALNLDKTPKALYVTMTNVAVPDFLRPKQLENIVKSYAPQLAQSFASNAIQNIPIPSINLSGFGGKYGIPDKTHLSVDKPNLTAKWDYAIFTGNLKQTQAK